MSPVLYFLGEILFVLLSHNLPPVIDKESHHGVVGVLEKPSVESRIWSVERFQVGG